MVAAVTIVLGEIFDGADDSEAVVAVTQRILHGPGDCWVIAKVFIGLIGNVVRRRADAKNGIQKELQRTAAGAHDQIGLTDGIGKAFAGA